AILLGGARAGGAFEIVAMNDAPLPPMPFEDPVYYMTTSEGPPGVADFTFSGATMAGTTVFEERRFPIEVYSRSTGGFRFGVGTQDVPISAPQSTQRVITPLHSGDGRLIGYLEIAGGPALGTAILHNVQRSLIVAGLIASVLAALVGWGISRDMSHTIMVLDSATRQMSDGDLTTRAHIKRTDELGHLADAFNTMAERIEDTVATLKRFVADAAHELHTPITAIQTNLELAATETDNPQLYINRAHAQLTRLATMTDNLLNLTRLEAGVGTHETEAVKLNDLLVSVSEFHASRAEQSDIQYTLNLPETPIVIETNEQQLYRALDNLIDNALKFTGERGAVTITLTGDGHLSVADSGIGIPEADQPFVFERFHRARNASPYPGNGIGLMLTKTIIEQSGGTITFESSPAGTTFNVCLPAVIHDMDSSRSK
ncbi:MAG: HAMP domain-containing histidine kinase, partial [Chloroflexi bacterium]|nr:HAMP domain-containing histidine kinase [Chloroflexota bacterium]